MAWIESVPQNRRYLTTRFGEHTRVLKPGLSLVLPPERVSYQVPSDQQTLNLFHEGQMWINFTWGGRARPIDARGFIRIKSPDAPYTEKQNDPSPNRDGCFRAIYNVSDWKVASREFIENVLRSFLNSLTVTEALDEGKAGYDLAVRGADGIPDNQLDSLAILLSHIGVELLRVTVTNFELDDETQRLRQARQRAQSIIQEIVYEYITTRTASTDMTEAEVREEVKTSIDLQDEIWTYVRQRVYDRMVAEQGLLRDVRTNATGGLDALLASFIAKLTS